MKKVIFAIVFLLALAGYVFVVGLKEFKSQALDSAGKISASFKSAGRSLLGLQGDDAQFYFSKIKEEIALLREQLPTFSNLIPIVKNLPPIFSNLTSLTTAADTLSQKIEILKKDGAGFVLKNKGGELIALLEEIQTDIVQVNRLIRELKAQAGDAKVDLDSEVAEISAQLYAADNFLEAFVSWLKEDTPHHLAILFQNSSEIRPAGGFIGSFAHLTLLKGGLINLEVNDIYDIDGQLTVKVVPPKQLQTVTTDWGARDANWFFDFPASARKVIYFLEASRIFQDRNTEFDGVVAINVNVIRDILQITGQVGKLNADNFLPEIQREVETEQSKDLLKEFTPLFFEKIGQLNDEQKNRLVEAIKERVEHKDVMVYLNDLVMESFIKNLGVGGEITTLPENFFGDYLAVVNANVAGGKTDAFINQHIKLSSRITNSGEIVNDLTISRQHSGQNEKDSWYRKTNQNFIQILTTPGSELISMEGGSEKEIKSAINYEKAGYRVDQDLGSVESGNPFGKTSFSTWLNTPAGQIRELNLIYKSPNQFDILQGPSSKYYHFVFDRQSGVKSELEFSIEAPPGFFWEETNSPYFTYKSDDPPSKVVIGLHLKSF